MRVSRKVTTMTPTSVGTAARTRIAIRRMDDRRTQPAFPRSSPLGQRSPCVLRSRVDHPASSNLPIASKFDATVHAASLELLPSPQHMILRHVHVPCALKMNLVHAACRLTLDVAGN